MLPAGCRLISAFFIPAAAILREEVFTLRFTPAFRWIALFHRAAEAASVAAVKYAVIANTFQAISNLPKRILKPA